MTSTRTRLITLWRIIRTLIPWRNNPYIGALLLMLLAFSANAQSLKTNSYYFELEINGSTNDVFIRGYSSPTATFKLTHEKNIISFYVSTVGRIQDDDFFTLDYWFGETNAVLVPELPRLLPYMPPQRTEAQLAAAALLVSNRIYKANQPKITPAQPKSGNKPVAVKPAAGPPKTP